MPVPVYGTFWVGYADDLKVKRLVTALEEVELRQPAQNVGQLLLANARVQVVLRIGAGEKDVVEGVIRKPVTRDSPPEPPSSYQMSIRGATDSYGRSLPIPSGASTVLMDTVNGVVALNAGSIMRA